MHEETPDSTVMLNTTFDSPVLQYLARQAADRCGGQFDFDALSAVILSYSAFEGFLNEITQLAQTLVRSRDRNLSGSFMPDDPANAPVDALALEMRAAQDRHAPVEDRYDLAWEVLTGVPIVRGEGARQNLGLLTKLRNALVHAKSEETQIYMDRDPRGAPEGFGSIWLGKAEERHEHPAFLKGLESRKLLAEGDHRQPWIHRVCTRDLAQWACDTVERLAAELIAHTREDSEFRKRLQNYSLSGTIERRVWAERERH